MNHNKDCYATCINKAFLLDADLLRNAEEIVSKVLKKAKIGRPSLDFKRALNGIYYLLKTGVQWKALPYCFGSSSAVHRTFQTLVKTGFFKEMWAIELLEYDRTVGLNSELQAMDCAHRKSPLGNEKVGVSPVDRRKHGTKLSVLSEKNGIVIGMTVGAANQHDSKLFFETIKSIPEKIRQPYYKEMHLDSAYDSEEIRTILFNYGYVPKIAPNQRRKKKCPPNPIGYCRWFIEPVHSWMNRFRAILIRFCKYAENYLALAQFAVSVIIYKKIRI